MNFTDDDDDDDEVFGGLYQDGHWVWDESCGALAFVSLNTIIMGNLLTAYYSDLSPRPVESIQKLMRPAIGAIEFKDDVDLIEQIRYRHRYQRKLKPGEMDIITLQDVKDLAIYTAPLNILSPMLINMLHLATTERFLRALILFTAYYLQISEVMAHRVIELETKVRTLECDRIENEFRENLSDLRILVAKEYLTMTIGGHDTEKYHHMGPQKKSRSLSDKDARFFETLLRMSVQIVWLALGRKCFNQIELEINRLFKSETFNVVEHTLKTGYETKMTPQERYVLLGHCVQDDQKLNIHSPLLNEVFCAGSVDYRLTRLGVIRYKRLTSRLKYLWLAVVAKEEDIVNTNVVLGIIGKPRSNFDTMLRPIPVPSPDKTRTSIACRSSVSSHGTSSCSIRKSLLIVQPLYSQIVLPPKAEEELALPDVFPDSPERIRDVDERQRRRWQNRLQKLMHPSSSKV